MQGNPKFSRRVQDLMDERGWTITDLAAKASVEVSTAGRWLRGTIPRRKMLLQLCKIFGVSEEDLNPPSPPSGGDEFIRRLDLALMKAGMNRTQLANSIGVAPSTISRWNGTHQPLPGAFLQTCEVLNVRREWLSAGLEPMEPHQDTNRLMEEGAVYRFTPHPDANQHLIAAMITILQSVKDGKEPVEELDRVHALLDLVRPLTQKAS